MKTISTLQNAAVGRCRERIAEAAVRAKGLIGIESNGTEPPYDCGKHSCGVTSALKRKHGL